MPWTWSNLDEVLDAWLATEPADAARRGVLEALVQLMEHPESIEGDPVRGERPLVRSVAVGDVEIVFLRAEEFRTLRLLRIRPRS